ncbi:MAG: DUF5063 domain-containing protein [Candidatus Delongbacteria bacterium]|jgi:hypothetical protein|nr:DUF5063 domain-containing protein [Candidatus Delongbacteria bacterium]
MIKILINKNHQSQFLKKYHDYTVIFYNFAEKYKMEAKQNILDFVRITKALVELIESASGMDSKHFVLECQHKLPMLYVAATKLPNLENELQGELEYYVTPEHYTYIKSSLNEKLGDFDVTVHLEDNFLMNTEDYFHVELSELFADIYQDIGNFMSQYRDGDEQIRNDAVWECKYNFDYYWGLRTLVLSEHLHRLVISESFRNKNRDNG